MYCVCGFKKGWKVPNTIGLNSMAEYSLSHTQTKSKPTNTPPKIASAAFDHEITPFLPSLSLNLQSNVSALRDRG